MTQYTRKYITCSGFHSLYHFIYSFRVTSVSSKRFCFKINQSYNMLHVWLLESSDPSKVAIEKDSCWIHWYRPEEKVTFESSRCKTSILTVRTACLVFKYCQKVQFEERFIKYDLGSLSENWKSLLIVNVLIPLWKSFNHYFEIRNTKQPVHTCECRKTNLKHYYRLVPIEPKFRAEKRNKYNLI